MNLLQLKKNDAKQKRQMQKKKAQSKAMGKEKMQQRADTQKIAGERQKRRHEMIKENARIIYNIINGIEDSFEKSSQEGNNLLLSKNEFTWCSKKNRRMLEELEKEILEERYGSETADAERKEFASRYRYYKVGEEDQEDGASGGSTQPAGELFSKQVLQ